MMRLYSLLTLSGLLLMTGCGINASTLPNTAVGTTAAMRGYDSEDPGEYFSKMACAMERVWGTGPIVTKEQVKSCIDSGRINRCVEQDKKYLYALYDIANDPARWNRMDNNKDGRLSYSEVRNWGYSSHVGGW